MTTALDRTSRIAVRRRSSWTPRASSDRGAQRVLVAFASRHGATREIAAALARALDSASRPAMTVCLTPVERAPDPRGFDAVVLGSAVYDHGWMPAARDYAETDAAVLRGRPTWLFSAGLLSEEPDDARMLGGVVGARGHRVFGGRLEPRVLAAAERGRWPVPHAAVDNRDMPAVRVWSQEIAADLGRLLAVPEAG